MLACPLDRKQLVFENGFRIVEQAPDQGAFAVIDAAGRNEAQELALIKFNSIYRLHLRIQKLPNHREPKGHKKITRFISEIVPSANFACFVVVS